MTQPEFVGSTRYRYEVGPGPTLTPWRHGDQFAAPSDLSVAVKICSDGSRLYVGEVVVTTNPKAGIGSSAYDTNEVVGERDGFETIDSQLWRAIPIGTLIDLTYENVRENLDKVAAEIADLWLAERAARPIMSKKRGPKSPLTPELLAQVVAPAYLGGGRKPTEAVRKALDARPDFLGSGPTGEVTPDQARKAVARARRDHLIPQVRTHGKSREARV